MTKYYIIAIDVNQKLQNQTSCYGLDIQLLRERFKDELTLNEFFDEVDEEFIG